ncbi:MAG: hypothetical protein C0625_14790 [Arcobacter sp.]|nr:MAG: hypothetical protein C0625_14790 [Arcobacter sp.]
MIRYFNSFIITTFIYVCLSTVMLFAFSSEKIILEKKVKKKTLSLKHVTLVKKEEVKTPIIKKEEMKKPVEKVVEKIVKKAKAKKIVKKKIIKKRPKKIVKKVVKKRVIKKVIKKEKVKTVEKKIKKVLPSPVTEKLTENNISPKVSVSLDYKENFLKENLYLIQKHIRKNVKYSKRARKLKIEGDVIIEFCLLKNGRISNIKALSGHKLLIKSTIKAIHKASISFPKVSQNITIKIPIEYKLI